MAEWRRNSTAGQLAGWLREQLRDGRWRGTMPGVMRLARELGVSRDVVEEALRSLEREGLLVAQGRGRNRLIDLQGDTRLDRGLRVMVLGFEPSDRAALDVADLLHALEEAGHVAALAPKTLLDMGHRVERVARLVEETAADAWVILAGTRPVLEWFAASGVPGFAYAGRSSRVPLPSIGPDKEAPLRQAISRLVELGHRRIALLARENRRKPEPGLTERIFLDELDSHGISPGAFNLPDWKESVAGFHAGLDALFRYTPPTALIIDEVPLLVAAMQFCLARGLQVPRDVSLICSDPGPAFDWCQPSISHIVWDHRPVIRRIVRWVNNVSLGRKDQRKGYTKARFVEGGTVGPVAGARARA